MQESETKESTGMTFLVKTQLSIEKLRVGVQVRNTHLAKLNRIDPTTRELEAELQNLEKFIDDKVATQVDLHPAEPWFSLINGIGQENIAKIIGLVNIEKAPYISSLWKWAGMHVVDGKSPRRKKGQKIEYNSQLRTMCWRLVTSIMRAQSGPTDKVPTRKEGKYYQYYIVQKNAEISKLHRAKVLIVPASKLPTRIVKGKKEKYEPEGMISEGHVDNRAKRKMIKLFLSHLWEVWRKALGLPITKPYILEYGEHKHHYDPWDFVDKK